MPGSAAELAAKVKELGRSIDIPINNADLVGNHGDSVKQGVAENAAQIQLNCVTLTELTGLYLRAMTAAGRGLVINVASTAAFQPTPGMAVYGATKAFVLSFTEALWQETKSTGVRVFALCPGATETEFFARTGEEFLTSGRRDLTAGGRHRDGRHRQVGADGHLRAQECGARQCLPVHAEKDSARGVPADHEGELAATENPPQTGGSPVTDLTEHQPQAQIANAQNAIQAQIRVVGDD